MNQTIITSINNCLKSVGLGNCYIDYTEFSKEPYNNTTLYSYPVEIAEAYFYTTSTWNSNIVNNKITKVNSLFKKRLKSIKACMQYVNKPYNNKTSLHIIFQKY